MFLGKSSNLDSILISVIKLTVIKKFMLINYESIMTHFAWQLCYTAEGHYLNQGYILIFGIMGENVTFHITISK